MFRLGYVTNGLANHRLLDSLRLCADLGYEAVAVTLDVGQLDPYDLRPEQVSDVRHWAEELGLALTVETGARFLLDPRRKHRPNLMDAADEGRDVRVDFYRRAIDIAVSLGAPLVSLWSGAAPGGERYEQDGADPRHPLLDHLAQGLAPVLEHAAGAGVQVAFEPEPGMFVERPQGYADLCRHLGAAADPLGLTLDVGHCLVTGDLPVAQCIRDWAHRLVHVHLDDIAGGVHQHLPFGQGDLDTTEVLRALVEVGFGGVAAVELSRDAHRGAEAAEEAMDCLRACLR